VEVGAFGQRGVCDGAGGGRRLLVAALGFGEGPFCAILEDQFQGVGLGVLDAYCAREYTRGCERVSAHDFARQAVVVERAGDENEETLLVKMMLKEI
jgi:hypothetical protein